MASAFWADVIRQRARVPRVLAAVAVPALMRPAGDAIPPTVDDAALFQVVFDQQRVGQLVITHARSPFLVEHGVRGRYRERTAPDVSDSQNGGCLPLAHCYGMAGHRRSTLALPEGAAKAECEPFLVMVRDRFYATHKRVLPSAQSVGMHESVHHGVRAHRERDRTIKAIRTEPAAPWHQCTDSNT